MNVTDPDPLAAAIGRFPAPERNGHPEAAPQVAPAETWAAFRDQSATEVPMLVDGLWPEGAVGFIGAAPKKGKTWLAVEMALSVAAGRRFLDRFWIPRPRPVLYVALEGSRPGLRARIGALARGKGLDPDNAADLEDLHLWYRPRGMNLSDAAWAARLVTQAQDLDAALIIIDVLRRAAEVRESGEGATDFGRLLRNLEPLAEHGRSIAFCHHFNKWGETSKSRSVAERLAGSGALYGAFDVGLFIVNAEDGARTMEIETEARELAVPPSFTARLEGDGSGPNGGYGYHDTASMKVSLTAPRNPGGRPAVRSIEMAEKVAEIRRDHPGIARAETARLLGVRRDHGTFRAAWDLTEPAVGQELPGAEPTSSPGRNRAAPVGGPRVSARPAGKGSE